MKSATSPARNLILFAFLVALGCETAPEPVPTTGGYEAFGLLGLDASQCRKRWGIPEETETEEGREVRVYKSKGFEVTVTFVEAKCAAVAFKKLDGKDLSADAIQTVLGHNANGWQEQPGETNKWISAKGSLATHADSTLTICNAEAAKEVMPRDE